MNNSHPPAASEPDLATLKANLRQILKTQPLDRQRALLQTVAEELETDILDCAAALLYHWQTPTMANPPEKNTLSVKMVRYRLDIGAQHQLCVEQLQKLLVEESGVDKNNIANVTIRNVYTLIDLPDAMPPDIFQHLKTVEINQRKLDIKRVKNRKKRGIAPHRRYKKTNNTDTNAS
jgi:DbpA RNA binding domain